MFVPIEALLVSEWVSELGVGMVCLLVCCGGRARGQMKAGMTACAEGSCFFALFCAKEKVR